VALTHSPIRDPSGRIVGVSSIARDISTLKQLEREREEWASVVAHDLRQPASTIHMAADMLARSETEPGRQRLLDRVRKSSVRLERMIEDLLNVSRIGAGHLAVKQEPVDLRPLIAEAVDLSPELAGRLRLEIDANAGRGWVDAGRFVQVLSNLLSNAAKYGYPNTPIDVRVEKLDGQVVVSVTNEGPGIAPDEIPRLFSRFARTRSAESGGVPGLGLGLYICRGIVEAHGGKLWVESLPGEKTHFRFTLPQAQVAVPERNAGLPTQAVPAH
jgi:signal transduction histidine kinase